MNECTEKERKITILIADDNRCFRDSLAEMISLQEDMVVLSQAQNGEEAVQYIESLKPDVALIDILMPLRDGFGVLEELKRKNITGTKCIIISAIDFDTILKKALSLGAAYFVVKPFRTDFLLDRIREVGKEKSTNRFSILPKGKKDVILNEQKETIKSEDPDYHITVCLNQLDISPSVKGYYFIKRAIGMVLENPEAMIGITKRMYPEIAKEFHTTASKVERAIRHAIESAWKRGSQDAYYDLTGVYLPNKPTNGRFIASIAEVIKLKESGHATA